MRIKTTNLVLCLAILLPTAVSHSQQPDESPRDPIATEMNSSRQEQEALLEREKAQLESDQRMVELERRRQYEQQQLDVLSAQRARQNGYEPVLQNRTNWNFDNQNQTGQIMSAFAANPSALQPPRTFKPEFIRANQEAENAIAKLVQQIRSSKDATEKEDLKSKIKERLSTQYDAYLDHHEEPLKKLEDRLKKLRDEFESRKQAKEDLVKLRLDTIWYEAIGLNWPASNRGFNNLNPPPVAALPDTTRRPNSLNQPGPTWGDQRNTFGPRRPQAPVAPKGVFKDPRNIEPQEFRDGRDSFDDPFDDNGGQKNQR